jgi:PAS domain S-box-containing protein
MAKVKDKYLHELEDLKSRLSYAEDALSAIRNGEVDAIIVSDKVGEKIFSLTSSETPYRILIENMEEGAVTLTKEGVILYCNPNFISMIGLPEEKIVGHKIFSFIGKADLKKFKNLLKIGKKKRGVGEFQVLIASGNEAYCHISVSALPADMTGDLFLIISNITTLKIYERKLEAERRRFEDTLNLVPGYVILVSPEDFSITFANKYFKARFGEPGNYKCYELVFGRRQRCVNCSHSSSYSIENPYHFESTDPKGQIYEIISFPYMNTDGVSMILELGIDITETRNLDKLILAKTFETEERDKKRFASDLHDDLGPTLSSVKMQLSMLSYRGSNDILKNCDALLDDCIEKMRSLAHNISPNLVEAYGLESALRSFIIRIENTHKLHFYFTSNIENSRFEKDIEVHLYRIIKELVNNTLKHVGQGSVKLDLRLNKSGLQVSYSDNGPGYVLQSKPSISSGSGLLNIKNRVSIMNGTFDLTRKDGHTVVLINILFP